MGTYRKALLIIMIASAVGLGIATYSFAHNQAFVSGSFCTISDTFNCDIVNRGPYSQIGGISVALIGVVGYLFLLVASILKWRKPEEKNLTLFLLLAAAGGFLFSLYLTGLEAFVLKTWCLFCLTSQAMIIIILGVTGWVWYHERKANHMMKQ